MGRMLLGHLLTMAVAMAPAETGRQACASCHAAIYRKYQQSAMARSSGAVGRDRFAESLEKASFAESGAAFRISRADGGWQLDFERQAGGVSGSRLLRWFVGSGAVGRSYLFAQEGYLFQAPVSYYSEPAEWGLSPGYDRSRIDLTRAVEPACLQCHATRVQAIAGTQNRYQAQPFLEGGIGCERCHGPGERHIAVAGKAGIVNPAKLDARRRDSVCAQCHLTGAARIARSGRQSSYRPGELLSDHLAVFVWQDAGMAEVSATSHFEKLSRSACRQASGDKLWCGSCHDPHEDVPTASQAAWYRGKCQACHATGSCKAPSASNDNCISCHMPKSATRAGEHVAYTDHSIPRQAGRRKAPGADRTLVSYFDATTGNRPEGRDLALGYAVVAPAEAAVRPRALQLLEAAARSNPGDVPVLVQLAQFYEKMRRPDRAQPLYEQVLRLDSGHPTAAVNLGILRVEQGDTAGAIALWRRALERNPALSGVRLNIGVAQYRGGEREAARSTLERVLDFDPDNAEARRLLAEMATVRR